MVTESNLVHERARQFEDQGYVVERKMFSADQMQDFINDVMSNERTSETAEELDRGSLRFYSTLFRRSALIRQFITQASLIDFLVPIIGPDFWVRWDQAVAKGPHSGVFAWHQDNGYNHLPQQHFQLWIALTEMTKDNGGLWLVPGTHKRRFPHRRIDNHLEAVGAEKYDAADSPRVFIQAEAGDVVLFSSLMLHKTYENITARPRWAYVAELMRLRDFDPSVSRPYFIAARGGKPAPEFVNDLPSAHDVMQILRTLPVALRYQANTVWLPYLRHLLKPSSPAI